ncbi:MAG: CBS domain-containing protein [Saprospiraceae bacterium]
MKNYKQKVLTSEPLTPKFNAPLVTEYMVSKLITFSPDDNITDVIDSLLENSITGAPVISSQNQVVGLIDDKDCLKVLVESAYHNIPITRNKVAYYMSSDMKSISNKDTIVDAANIFLRTYYKRLQVKDENGKLVGQISRRDILRAIKDLNTHF